MNSGIHSNLKHKTLYLLNVCHAFLSFIQSAVKNFAMLNLYNNSYSISITKTIEMTTFYFGIPFVSKIIWPAGFLTLMIISAPQAHSTGVLRDPIPSHPLLSLALIQANISNSILDPVLIKHLVQPRYYIEENY